MQDGLADHGSLAKILRVFILRWKCQVHVCLRNRPRLFDFSRLPHVCHVTTANLTSGCAFYACGTQPFICTRLDYGLCYRSTASPADTEVRCAACLEFQPCDPCHAARRGAGPEFRQHRFHVKSCQQDRKKQFFHFRRLDMQMRPGPDNKDAESGLVGMCQKKKVKLPTNHFFPS